MKVLNLVVDVWKLVAKYPALTAGVFNVIIVVGAQLGFNLTASQLTTVAGVVAAVFGVLVHAGVIPVTKVDNVKAGVKPTVPPAVVVAEPESHAKTVVDLPRVPATPKDN